LRPRAPSVPYPREPAPEAAPKGISGRTSYLRARLAFHPYPQLFPAFCNRLGFGPPVRVSGPSPWPWVARPVSGLLRATSALFRLAFAPPPRHHPLKHATRNNSPAHSSISTRSALRPLTACRRTVSGSFHPPPGVLFTFPSRYSFTIGRQEYLALEGGPPSFPRDCTGPAVLKHGPRRALPFTYRAVTCSGLGFHPVRLGTRGSVAGSWARLVRLPTPAPQRPRPWHGVGLG
jgi:hypothetical protein